MPLTINFFNRNNSIGTDYPSNYGYLLELRSDVSLLYLQVFFSMNSINDELIADHIYTRYYINGVQVYSWKLLI